MNKKQLLFGRKMKKKYTYSTKFTNNIKIMDQSVEK